MIAMHTQLANHLNLMNQEMMTMMIDMRAEITTLHTAHQETHNNLIKIEKLPPYTQGEPCMMRWEW